MQRKQEILTAAAKNEKPDANEKILAGMVQGRLNKELKDICLLDQTYIKAEDGKERALLSMLKKLLRLTAQTSRLRATFVLKQAKVSKRRTKISQLKLKHR